MRLHGKTLAVGGYAVLAPAGCGLALPVKSTAMDVLVSVAPGLHRSITLVLPRAAASTTVEIPAEKTDLYTASDPETAFVRTACLVLLAYLCTKHDGLEITVKTSESRPPGAKLGVGSSAMVTVGTIVELASCIGVELREAETFVLAHFSCLLVQGQSSGYDVASVLSQTPIVYRQSGQYHSKVCELAHAARSGSCLSALMPQLQILAHGDELPKISPISLPQFRFYLLKPQHKLDRATSTKKQLQKLAPTYGATQSYEQLVKTSEALINAFIAQKSSIEHIRKQLQRYRQAQRSFSTENGVEIEPKEISDLLELLMTKNGVVGAMCVGAGGYDAFLCITTSAVTDNTFDGYLVVDITM
ncbi:Hypothetical protein GLP15_3439 [Giardia lamblia P15]|uniref:phosphomevalonate kinase n=1 Tax=Giardia intestinalis (strain P15) TaxID=658858 RepID=E1F0B3_GIAIA|nr:Hypothetical protein GLP15_3439 [Giardia lamblia P15]